MPSEGHWSGHATKFSAYRATYLAQIERGSFRQKLISQEFFEPVTDEEAELANSQREKKYFTWDKKGILTVMEHVDNLFKCM